MILLLKGSLLIHVSNLISLLHRILNNTKERDEHEEDAVVLQSNLKDNPLYRLPIKSSSYYVLYDDSNPTCIRMQER